MVVLEKDKGTINLVFLEHLKYQPLAKLWNIFLKAFATKVGHTNKGINLCYQLTYTTENGKPAYWYTAKNIYLSIYLFIYMTYLFLLQARIINQITIRDIFFWQIQKFAYITL